MKNLVLNPLTRQQVDVFTAKPSHALMLVGPRGSGKHTLAAAVAETVMGLPEGGFAGHPYALVVAPEDGKAIGIEAARQLERFLALKVPGKNTHDRVIIIEDAHLLTTEAQNALLKTLEEPPEGTILILTATHEQTVLPTIRSRTQLIPVGPLGRDGLEAHFAGQDFDAKDIRRAYAISGGLPGLMHALLHETDHPLVSATERARELLSRPAYERLTTVDELAKQKALALDVTAILQQMARLGLQTAAGPVAKKWQDVLAASYDASEALAANAQPKLALTKLMLSL
jgi:DNA polymerase III delta prime subunit